MKIEELNNESSLKLTRFCGEELYPIKKATWHLYKDEENNTNELWLEIETDKGIVLHEDTESLNGRPHWELTCRIENLNIGDLQTGFRFEIPSGYDEDIDDSVTNFYYCEHEQSDNNTIEILATERNHLQIRVTGEVTDINYYDGSKPKNKILIETWFEPLHPEKITK